MTEIKRRGVYLILLTLIVGGCAPEYTENTVESKVNQKVERVIPGNNSMIEGYLGVNRTSEELDNFLMSKMEEMAIPGIAAAVINNGQVVYHNTLGYADVENNLPVTSETIFEAASISKPVFAFFVMMYVEEGKLDLDRPLYEYLPYSDIAYDERYKKITARMVLSHRGGFPNWRTSEDDGQLRIYFEPGTDYLYSGEGYQYLAKVLMQIEHTDDQGLEAAFQRRVAEPLGLEHTVFLQTPHTREHKAVPYNERNERLDPMEKSEFGAAYSLHTEPLDFSRWMIAVMNRQLLSETSYEELFTRHSTVPSDNGFQIFYTLGFITPDLPDTDIYMHSGNNDGFTCMFLVDTEKDWGLAVFTNSEFGYDVGDALADYLAAEPVVD